MDKEFVRAQPARIKYWYDFLKEERVVTSKDIALQWIIKMGTDYDQLQGEQEVMQLIDQVIAYAQLALEKPE